MLSRGQAPTKRTQLRKQCGRLSICWIQRGRCGGEPLSLSDIRAVAFNSRQRKQAVSVPRMPFQICAEYRNGIFSPPQLVKGDALNIGIAWLLWPQRTGLTDRAKRIRHAPLLGECQR